MSRKKISLIGGGNIGGTLAHLCMIENLGDVVLHDIKEDFVKGKALDIAQAAYIQGSDVKIMGTANYADTKNSHVIIITAGMARKPGMSRDDLININYGIIKDIAENVKTQSPNAFVIIVTNPLDAMVYAFQKLSGMPKNMVIGMAGVLDTARFCHFLSEEFNVSKKDVSAMVLGGHGDTMVPVLGSSFIAGVSISEYAESHNVSQETLNKIVQRTRDGGGEIVKLLGNGSAFYAPATAAIAMARSYLNDEKRILPCAAKLDGEFAIRDLYIGVQVKIGRGGCEEIIVPKLSEHESDALRRSSVAVQELKDLVDAM